MSSLAKPQRKFLTALIYDKIVRKFEAQTAELKTYSDQQTDELARIIAESVANLMHERFDKLEEGVSNGQGLRFFEPTFTELLKRRQIWSM